MTIKMVEDDHDEVTVTVTKAGDSVHYRLKADSKAAIEAAIERIERTYHPVGYGTSFWPPKQQDDGSWECFGYRSSSCD